MSVEQNATVGGACCVAAWGDATANSIGPIGGVVLGAAAGAALLGLLVWLYVSESSPAVVRMLLHRFRRVLVLALYGAAAVAPFAVIGAVAYAARNVSGADARHAVVLVVDVVGGVVSLAIVGRFAEAWSKRVRARWASPPADDAARRGSSAGDAKGGA